MKKRMRRKFFISAFAALFSVLCFSAAAQQSRKIPTVGFLGSGGDAFNRRFEVFRRELRDRGWVEGKNIVIELRYASGMMERFPEMAAELVNMKVNVIVANGTPATQAAKNATATIPIVGTGTDLVGTGIVDSLAHPGGNVTGISNLNDAVAGKQLELIKEIFPKVSRVAVLWDPRNAGNAAWLARMKASAEELRVALQPLAVRTDGDFDSVLAAIVKERAGAFSVFQNTLIGNNRGRILDFAAKKKLPAIYPDSTYAEVGGLMSYGPSGFDTFRRVAYYVDRILKGAKPGDLPVEQPTKFELVINLKTAKEIGLTIPPNVLARADRVIK